MIQFAHTAELPIEATLLDSYDVDEGECPVTREASEIDAREHRLFQSLDAAEGPRA